MEVKNFTDHGEEVRVIKEGLVDVLHHALLEDHSRHCQTEIGPENMDYHGSPYVVHLKPPLSPPANNNYNSISTK